VGQRPVTQTLKNAIAKDRIAHALLFAGPRGVGKTTTARILAKALNCEQGRTPDPCNRCATCKEIAEGRSVDCLEIDGASNRGIDEVRELREIVRYAPSLKKFKVIIIDEVHMLTEPAFNALLKTLEEPPPGVVFILATTDAHKIPPTILSRCQRHDFRKLGQAEIVERLQEIVREEHAKVADGALKAIAGAAEGSLRDAQSLLDQVIAYSGAEVSEADVGVVMGLVEGEQLARATQAIIGRDGGEALSARGYDLQRFCQEMLAHLRDLMVAKVVKDPAPLLQASRVSPETIRSQAQAIKLADLEATFHVLSRAEFEMRRASRPRFVLEMALVEAAEARPLQSLEALLQRLSTLEERLLAERGPAAPTGTSELPLFAGASYGPGEEQKDVRRRGARRDDPPRVAEQSTPLQGQPSRPDPQPETPLPSLGRPVSAGVEEGWAHMKRLVEGKKPTLAAVLGGSKSVILEGETLIVTLENGTPFARSTLADGENRLLVAAAAFEAFGRRLKVEYRFQAPSISPGVSGSTQLTTGRVEPPEYSRLGGTQHGPSEPAQANPDDLRRHPLVQRALELFDGQVVRVSEQQP
jgi:DNA polymerase-3 subunit gamma/tau